MWIRIYRLGLSLLKLGTINSKDDGGEILWGWHCRIAMSAVDAGADKMDANERTPDVIADMFGFRPESNSLYRVRLGDLLTDLRKAKENEKVDEREKQEFGTPIK